MARKKKILEIEIIKTIFPNKSIGKDGDRIIRVKGGIRGQKVKVLLGRTRKDYSEGRILEVIEPSALEKNLDQAQFPDTGPCPYQSLLYEDELKLKEEMVMDLFRDAGIENLNYLGMEASPLVDGYRNKMEYTFGNQVKDGPLILGMHRRGKFYEIVDSSGCNLADGDFTLIRKRIMEYFRNLSTPFYNKRSHQGILRHLVIRKAYYTGQIMINLVSSSQGHIDMDKFLEELLSISQLEGKITSVFHSINDGLGDVVAADRLELVYGKDYIVDEILGLSFKISPFSFFQTNTRGAERLYTIVREFIGDKKSRTILDLYSGTGTIAQILSPLAEKVIGIEIVEEAVKNAIENSKLNGLDNVEFIRGDVLKEIDRIKERPDLIIIDPPRDGIHPKAIKQIIDFSPESFIYVSCNPVSLVRDLKVFLDRGYGIDKMKLMDMFPRTGHVEAAILMTYCGLEDK